MGRFINLENQRFGRLVVNDIAGRDNRGEVLWRCKCDCGNTIIALSSNLRRNNHTMSCGCYKKEILKTVNKTHGMSKSSIYSIWCAMKRRCYQEKSKDYTDYGARGITVCDEWKNNFENFYEWAIRNGYEKGLSIDRINVNGNYEPSNCRWATLKEQANNKRNNHLIEYNGEAHTMKEWSEILGINYYTLHSRLRNNWTIERAFNVRR